MEKLQLPTFNEDKQGLSLSTATIQLCSCPVDIITMTARAEARALNMADHSNNIVSITAVNYPERHTSQQAILLPFRFNLRVFTSTPVEPCRNRYPVYGKNTPLLLTLLTRNGCEHLLKVSTLTSQSLFHFDSSVVEE